MAAHQAQLKAQREKQRKQERRAASGARPELNAALLGEGALCERLGIPVLRPFQRQVLTHLGVLGNGEDDGEATGSASEVLGVQPTGAGKSVCFQAAAATLPGTTLVVSPLLSLMFDQVASLRATGIRVATLNSMQSATERDEVMGRLEAGDLDLLYTSPEQLEKNQKLVRTLRALPVPLLAIDEAHCISSWGHDFRPSYRRVSHLRATLRIPRLVALTASAPPAVRKDIVAQLAMGPNHLQVVSSCHRPNILLARRPKTLSEVVRAVSAAGARPALVYTQTRKEVDLVADELALTLGGARHALRYHAGMSSTQREEAQEAFVRSEAGGAVMVATNAFGMGIDKSDIRTVVHWGPPGSIEAYYQEFGRGGRDGGPCRAVLLASERADSDLHIHRFFLNLEHPRLKDIERVWRAILSLGREAPGTRGDLVLAFSVSELQDATARSGPKVAAISKCVRLLEEWRYVERQPSRTTITLHIDSGTRQRFMRELAAAASEPELSLPPGMRKGTQQARVWCMLASKVLGGVNEDAEERQVQRAFETEAVDRWVAEAELEPRQFVNAIAALQKKGLVEMQRPASLQVRVPASARSLVLPTEGDERLDMLAQGRKAAEARLRGIEEYMTLPIEDENAGRVRDESDHLWQQIMQYFGEGHGVPDTVG